MESCITDGRIPTLLLKITIQTSRPILSLSDMGCVKVGSMAKWLLIAATDNNKFIIIRPIQMGNEDDVYADDERLPTLYHCQQPEKASSRVIGNHKLNSGN